VKLSPSAVENIVHHLPEAVEFAVDIHGRGALDEMEIRREVKGA
jgi:hypothetical protein